MGITKVKHLVKLLLLFYLFNLQILATEVILYMQVDLVKRHCFPVYWNAENRRVMRGHWFARKGGLDWLPLREDVAEQLEIAYRSRVCFFLLK